jgi:hypothetical protein
MVKRNRRFRNQIKSLNWENQMLKHITIYDLWCSWHNGERYFNKTGILSEDKGNSPLITALHNFNGLQTSQCPKGLIW